MWLAAAGLAAFGSRRKEQLEVAVAALLEETMGLAEDEPDKALTAIRTVDLVLTNIIKQPHVSYETN